MARFASYDASEFNYSGTDMGSGGSPRAARFTRADTSRADLMRQSSKATVKSRGSARSGAESCLDEDEKKKKKVKEHPYDKVFGKHVTQHLARSKHD